MRHNNRKKRQKNPETPICLMRQLGKDKDVKNLPEKGTRKLFYDSYSFCYHRKLNDPKLPTENQC